MKLVLARSILKAEFGSTVVPDGHREALERSCRVALAEAIRGEALPPSTRLLKVYVTTPEGPRRVVHLLAVADGTLFLLFYRDKKDAVGANVSIRNPVFRKLLHRHLDLLQRDLESGAFDTW